MKVIDPGSSASIELVKKYVREVRGDYVVDEVGFWPGQPSLMVVFLAKRFDGGLEARCGFSIDSDDWAGTSEQIKMAIQVKAIAARRKLAQVVVAAPERTDG